MKEATESAAATKTTAEQAGGRAHRPSGMYKRLFADVYRLEECIGDGSSARVYRATHEPSNRPVALKLIRAQFLGDPSHTRRFYREAFAATQIYHTNIVELYDFGQDASGQLYQAYELLEGQSIESRLSVAPIPLLEALDILAQVLRGLEVIHAAGFVHRDIKPDNIVVLPDGKAKIVDFGIVRPMECVTPITLEHLPVGTPSYMAPEQARGEKVSPSTDVWAAGALLFAMLSAREPFVDDTLKGLLDQITDGPLPNLHELRPLPSGVVRIVNRAMNKSPEYRFIDARAMYNAVAELEICV